MIVRLGRAIYWICCGISALGAVGFAFALVFVQTEGWVPVAFAAVFVVIVFGFGRVRLRLDPTTQRRWLVADEYPDSRNCGVR
jgi:hypothetical protein